MKTAQASEVITIKKSTLKTVAVTGMALILAASAISAVHSLQFLPLYVSTPLPEFIGCWIIAILSALALQICPSAVLFRFIKPSFKLYSLISGTVAVVLAAIFARGWFACTSSGADLWGVTDFSGVLAIIIAVHLAFAAVVFALSLLFFRAVKKLWAE